MEPFAYWRAGSVAEALAHAREQPGARFLAGGTELVNWLKDGIVAPSALIDISRLDLARVTLNGDRLRIGALARLGDLASHELVRRHAMPLAAAIEQAASPAIRASGTLAGNLLQRTRCPYFRGGGPCNKRFPSSGCGARAGDHRAAAVLGISDRCIATHPSDPAVALVAQGAELIVEGRSGRRSLAVEALYPMAPEDPRRDLALAPDELVTEVSIPLDPLLQRGGYRKVRDRASYDFALVSAAALGRIEDGKLGTVRLALGGVAPGPWRCRTAERILAGRTADEGSIREAMTSELAAATPLPDNRFKIELAIRAATGVLRELSR